MGGSTPSRVGVYGPIFCLHCSPCKHPLVSAYYSQRYWAGREASLPSCYSIGTIIRPELSERASASECDGSEGRHFFHLTRLKVNCLMMQPCPRPRPADRFDVWALIAKRLEARTDPGRGRYSSDLTWGSVRT